MVRMKVNGAVRRMAPVVAVVAAAGAGALALSMNNTVSAAEAHGALLPTAVEGIQGVQVAEGNVANGTTAFVRCRVCHTVEKGEPNRVGPNLFGVVGRAAGTVAGFAYSDAMKNSKLTWTDENLEKYIQDPPGTVPGNKMNLAKGAVNKQSAEDLIAFLKTKK